MLGLYVKSSYVISQDSLGVQGKIVAQYYPEDSASEAVVDGTLVTATTCVAGASNQKWTV